MRALVLSGGGSKGAFQVGVLRRWMRDQGRDYDIICGVSVGALNTAGLGMTKKGNPVNAQVWLEDFWKTKVTTSSIYKRWFPFGRLHSLWRQSVYNSAPLIKLVNDNVDLDRVSSSGRILSVGAVCLDTGEHTFARECDPDFIKWVLASASFPVFLQPIEIGGKLWSDGGIKNVTPLGEAIRLGATEIDVVMCSNMHEMTSWDSDDKVAIPDQAVRTVGLMSDQIVKNDIEICGLKNDLAEINHSFRKVRVRVVMPDQPLTKDSLNFDPDSIHMMMEIGYSMADKFVVYD
jgi:NTE family protein